MCTPPKFKANLKAFLRKRRHPQARGFNFLEIHFNRWIFGGGGGGYHIYIYIGVGIMETKATIDVSFRKFGPPLWCSGALYLFIDSYLFFLGGVGGVRRTLARTLNSFRAPCGWLSKSLSFFGYPKYYVPYYNRVPKKGTMILTTTHVAVSVKPVTHQS